MASEGNRFGKLQLSDKHRRETSNKEELFTKTIDASLGPSIVNQSMVIKTSESTVEDLNAYSPDN
jgi:hypothetical protein